MKMKVSGFDEILKALSKVEASTVDASIKAVDKAALILKSSLQSEIGKAANRGYATGSLQGSVSVMKARENEYGVFSVVGPQGKDDKGVSNEDKLLWLENGTLREGTNLMKRAGPIRRRAVNSARTQCEEIMEKEINNLIDKTFGG